MTEEPGKRKLSFVILSPCFWTEGKGKEKLANANRLQAAGFFEIYLSLIVGPVNMLKSRILGNFNPGHLRSE